MRPWLSGCLCLRWLKHPIYRTHPVGIEKGRKMRKASTNAQSMVEEQASRPSRHTPISAKTPVMHTNRPLREYVFPRKKQNSVAPVVPIA